MKYRAKVHNMKPGGFTERLKWCRDTFGHESHSRWMPKYSHEFRFALEEDLALYLLRWS